MKHLRGLITQLLFFITIGTFAQTNVSGAYFTNTSWTLSGSPYNITGDVQVPANITLSIEPGVVINFTGDYQILVKGIFIANGTATSPISFTGNTSGKAMIMFRSTNLSNSQLSYLKFTGPKNGLQLEDESEYSQSPIKATGTLTINNAEFNKTTVYTKGYETTAAMVINNATITSTTVRGVYPRSEPININNSSITGSVINSDSYNKGITVNNSSANNTQFTLGCCGANIQVIKSTIENSSFTDYNNYYSFSIQDSKIINSPINLSNSDYGATISNSTITYNTGFGIKCKNLKMTGTTVDGSGQGTAIELFGGNNSISKSHLINNTIGVKVTANNSMKIDSSDIYNNIQYNIQNLAAQNITAQNNWWGTTNETEITNKIYDYYDNINYGIVDYSKGLTSNSFTVTLSLGANGAVKADNVTLGNGSVVSIEKGTTKTFTIVPNAGYSLSTISYNGSTVKSQLVNNQYTIPTITANSTLSVTFQRAVYKLSIQTGGSGTTNLNYYYGETPSFDFTPSDGYKIKSVFYNGNDVTSSLSGNVYTVPAITSNGSLVVNFEGITLGNISANDNAISVFTTETGIVVHGVPEGEIIRLYSVYGQLLQSVKSQTDGVILNARKGAIYIVKTDSKKIKVSF
ncbi:MAG: right-handed parallel beta-helix repeat-containing protein [Bacteroidota bacterium]|nr:right-handed parallel beta-helix repeat-containing protein [Bacteroidota bacterium]